MARMEFKTAVKQAEAEANGEAPEPFEFSIGGEEFVAQLPSGTQLSMLSIAISEGSNEALKAALDIFDGLLEGNGGKRLRRMLANGTITGGLLFWGDELNPVGIIGALVEQVSGGRPTTPSSDSSATPETSGRRSTGRARAKASTPSDSEPTDS